jgi:hypothetical protein
LTWQCSAPEDQGLRLFVLVDLQTDGNLKIINAELQIPERCETARASHESLLIGSVCREPYSPAHRFAQTSVAPRQPGL